MPRIEGEDSASGVAGPADVRESSAGTRIAEPASRAPSSLAAAPAARCVPPEALLRRADLSDLPFETTEGLEELSEVVGQDRAVEAIRFAVGMRREGYNLFALGRSATGKSSILRRFLEERAAAEPPPSDWCYVNNFDDPAHPRALRLPAGAGRKLKESFDRLVEELRVVLPAVLESEQYRARKQAIEEEFKQRQAKALDALEEKARLQKIAFVRTPIGFLFAPLEGERVVPQEEFDRLPEAERNRIAGQVAVLQEELHVAVRQFPAWEKESREKIKALTREETTVAVGHLIDALRQEYRTLPAVQEHLDAVQLDLIENADDFLTSGEAGPLLTLPFLGAHGGLSPFRRYAVNVLVDNAKIRGAPIVHEGRPSHPMLVGEVEHISQMGTLLTDFLLVKAGALHRANGGYLVLDARQVLRQPYAWEALKQALRAREVRIEPLSHFLGLGTTVSLDPDPIPLEVKVVLVGERLLYYLLCDLDPEFGELFKVAADFEDEFDRSPRNALLYARLLGTLARRERLLPLSREAVARVLEESARLAADAEKLSARVGIVADLVREADWWAARAGRRSIASADVESAVEAQTRRASRLQERVYEEIRRGTLLIDTAGERVGQANGLSCVQLGQYAFGRPSRITARVRLGRGEVVDIERQVELGGPIHSKGVLILSGFLGAKYVRDRPLALCASLVFEQSYGLVEGDSASAAELCALLSALADLPIRQSVAITGSVNQQGQLQAVGAVNEKIEGFFDVCVAGSLSGAQGVVIPSSNRHHLMLRDRVVEAARQGRFHVWPAETIDQAMEILTGLPAGERDGAGRFPADSVNGRVEARLAVLADRQREFGQQGDTAGVVGADRPRKGPPPS
jgi:predicted ATP-dependent protease